MRAKIIATLLTGLFVLFGSTGLMAEKGGKGHGAGGVSEEKMSEMAAEKRKAYAGEKEKKEKEAKEEKEEKEENEKKEKREKKVKKSK